MIDIGIEDGDSVLIHSQSTAENGQNRDNNTEKNEMHKTIETLNKRIFDLLEAKEIKDFKST